jgi:hypothetical protein
MKNNGNSSSKANKSFSIKQKIEEKEPKISDKGYYLKDKSPKNNSSLFSNALIKQHQN